VQGLGAKRILQSLKADGINCKGSVGTVGHLRDCAVFGGHQPRQYLETGPVADGDPVLKFSRIVDQTEFDIVATRLDSKLKPSAMASFAPRPATVTLTRPITCLRHCCVTLLRNLNGP
jgi:hypothetical protein